MKKLVVLLGVVFFSGCLIRTYTIYKPRTNTEVSGNRGYLSGAPKTERDEGRLGDMRPVTVFEFELGGHKPSKKASSAGPAQSAAEAGRADIMDEITSGEEPAPQVSGAQEDLGMRYEYYIVQKNDTLQKISKSFYGTTRRWMFIYEHNKDVMKSPDKAYPGMKLRIPKLIK